MILFGVSELGKKVLILDTPIEKQRAFVYCQFSKVQKYVAIFGHDPVMTVQVPLHSLLKLWPAGLMDQPLSRNRVPQKHYQYIRDIYD